MPKGVTCSNFRDDNKSSNKFSGFFKSLFPIRKKTSKTNKPIKTTSANVEGQTNFREEEYKSCSKESQILSCEKDALPVSGLKIKLNKNLISIRSESADADTNKNQIRETKLNSFKFKTKKIKQKIIKKSNVMRRIVNTRHSKKIRYNELELNVTNMARSPEGGDIKWNSVPLNSDENDKGNNTVKSVDVDQLKDALRNSTLIQGKNYLIDDKKGTKASNVISVLKPKKFDQAYHLTCNTNKLNHPVQMCNTESSKSIFKRIADYISSFFVKNISEMSWNKYHNLQGIKNYLYEMEKKYPHLVKVECIGRTIEHRSLLILTISETISHTDTIFIEGGVHAREWISPATATYIINKLLTEWPYLPEYITNKTWIILPVTNPDGYHYSWTRNRMWRKNRTKDKNSKYHGVDLNRNFDCAWAENPYDDPCHKNYGGSKPFSEKESQAIRDFLLPIKNKLKAYISLHSYGQQIRFLWNLNEPIFDCERVYEVAEIGLKKMCKLYNATYTIKQAPSKFVYGSSRDWARKYLNIKYAYVIELRDRGQKGYLLPASEIIASAKEAIEFIFTIAWAIDGDLDREQKSNILKKNFSKQRTKWENGRTLSKKNQIMTSLKDLEKKIAAITDV